MGLSGPLPYGSCLWTFRGSGSFKPVGLSGLEPPTSRLSGVRSNQLSYKPILKSFDFSGDEEIRTLDPLLARQVLSQLSYIPIWSGIHLLSHTVSSAVPSAACVLTVVFGMGTGVSHKRIDTRNMVIKLLKATKYLLVVMRLGGTPVPIPNTMVKT